MGSIEAKCTCNTSAVFTKGHFFGCPLFVSQVNPNELNASYHKDQARWENSYINHSTGAVRKRVIAQTIARTNGEVHGNFSG